jgi:hypothetical protein
MHHQITSSVQSFGLWALLVAGCSSNGAATPTTDCAGLADSTCAKLDACAPFVALFFFEDRASCTNYLVGQCNISMSAPGTGLTSAVVRACIRDMDGVSCDRFGVGNLYATSCLPQGGAVQTTGACGDDWQCASGRCSTPGDAKCGVCVTPTAEGGVCTNDECAPGLTCVFGGAAGSGICRPPFPSGGPCDSTRPCADGAICQRQSANSDQGLCQPPRQVGQSCSPGVVACDYRQNAQCSPFTSLCELPVATVIPGQACGWINNQYYFCHGSCGETSPSSLSGTCIALNAEIAEGQPCTPGDRCQLGTRCIEGICLARNPSMCTAR